ncbi:MAG: glycosyltransferase family 32 protein [Intestinibacter bartlettii]|uniref:glycosyltransferase family 32 protein n=1 Tax=Intestinibacter bartlettii TaxID=261299 RepID=UPI0039A0C234
MIEKKINYCWFGGNEKSEIIQKCIKSWQKYCPDYEIIEWNESNFDVNLCKYTKDAYKNKKWAFVSDVARLWVIYNNGGIYLDTDVELFSSLDELLKYDAWFASDDIKYVATGLGFGAKKDNMLVKKMLEDYYIREFDVTPCPVLNTKIIFDTVKDFKRTYDNQIIDNMLFLSSFGYAKYAKHYYTFTYGTEEQRKKHQERKQKCSPLKWKLRCKLRNPKLINYVEDNKDKLISKIYTFLVYDLIDYGLMYYIKRFLKKC